MLPKAQQRVGAFSLIEVLVVVGLILLTLVLGNVVVQSLRNRAIQVRCLANIRQIGSALLSYQQDNRGCFPKHWDGSSAWYGPGLLGAYLAATRDGPYVCPGTKATTYSLRQNNYIYNYYLGEYGGRRVSLQLLPSPQRTWVMGDGTGPNYVVSIPETEVNFGWQHGGRGNWLFADGHIESVGPLEYERSWIRFPMQ